MTYLILGLVVFLGAHAVTSKRDLRRQLIDRFGAGGFRGIYSAVSLVGLLLIIYGFGVYRASGWINVWNPPVWTKHLSLLLMLPVFVLLATNMSTSWIAAKVKHPMLLAVKIWATAHLLANGDLGSILLFGSILAWAVVARISTKRRPEEIARLANAVAVPFGTRDIIALAVGLTLYVATILWLHPLLIGVAVLPGR
jgi:uncharacterized membrane protein